LSRLVRGCVGRGARGARRQWLRLLDPARPDRRPERRCCAGVVCGLSCNVGLTLLQLVITAHSLRDAL
jgi:hypothetical protein